MAEGGLKFYILATNPGLSPRNLAFKHGDTFALFNAEGDIVPGGLGELGLYHRGTRFLSRLELFCCHTKPFLLSSSLSQDGLLIQVNLTNPDLFWGRDLFIPRGGLHIRRTKVLYEGDYYEELVFTNYSLFTLDIPVTISFAADFADIFEVRGVKREKKGHILPPVVEEDRVLIRYHGLDGLTRLLEIVFSDLPGMLRPDQAQFLLKLAPKERVNLGIKIRCLSGEERLRRDFKAALFLRRKERKALLKKSVQVETSNEHFNFWLERSTNDLFMMLTHTPYGLYPYAGIPWFNTVFGRDGLIVGLQTLWFNPDIARGVLEVLARTQAQEKDPARDAEPGKILHEMRFGEMAATGEVPFGRYYGSVDATPLFIILAGAYYERTQDLEFIRKLWPHLELALHWIEDYGDQDRDGLVEYAPSEEGLVNKGWKDSHDSVFHRDGRFPEPPIALVEVQGYVYRAYLEMAKLARALGKHDLVLPLLSKAETMRNRIKERFWDEDSGFLALALDGRKAPCWVKTSNPGHLFFAEALREEEAQRLVEGLFAPDMFSGWGIRTVSRKEVLYNPVSYHNGSVWPHDNALIAEGLARYGFKDHLERVFKGLFEASHYFPHHRLPELFCGFTRRAGEGPVPYPVACSPQAWSSGVIFMLLAASLGLRFTGKGLCFFKPRLPSFLSWVRFKGLRVGESTIDLELIRYEKDVVVNVLRKPKVVEVMVIK
ncbi:amylo-alpha-1,6-glucosidase [Thermosulfurimonas dismutans]|uniref:Glycogen debranching enzyme n=1 Tax=Thermosulfurimonas dismutans TaxID=999894 RepID=A0A179D2N9_9BACT|nr:amylo-alpha-1,6-glucosidase [Thermosulfurimonas dismutans]OAQ20243.1 Glycogen debranching enzyme [Thermosulfurimonas dismutans]